MPPRLPSFSPPPPPPGPPPRGCAAALAAAGAALLAGVGLCGLTLGAFALVQAARPSRPAPVPAPAAADAPGRSAWGEIRARYRAKNLAVPA